MRRKQSSPVLTRRAVSRSHAAVWTGSPLQRRPGQLLQVRVLSRGTLPHSSRSSYNQIMQLALAIIF